jgi:putative endonuclease
MSLYKRHVVGKQGEDVACIYLTKKGFQITERNYRKKWGELDIIAKKDKILHFFEVKTVSCENLDVVRLEKNGFRPEENIHPRKLERITRTIQSYLGEPFVVAETLWQFDALIVFLDEVHRKAYVRTIENIVLNE